MATSLPGVSAYAEPESSRTVAREQFQQGLALARDGDLHSAVEAFQRAYQTSPHHTVLYNLGQAYIGLGRPVEAVDALERFLTEGDEMIDPARHQEVKDLLERERRHVGRLDIQLIPDDARLFIDGKSTEAPGVHALTSGRHVVGVSRQGYVSHVEEIEILAGETVHAVIELRAEVQAVGQLVISCELPNVEVSVDGRTWGQTPFEAPLLVAVGPRKVRLARVGYRTVEQSVMVSPTKQAEITCPMVVDPRGAQLGRLKVAPSESFAIVIVNGLPYEDAPLPPGPHVVRVERAGFRPVTRKVIVEPGRSHTIMVHLEPTPSYLAEREAHARVQRNVALGVGAGGIALVGTSIALFVWNGKRYDDWRGTANDTNPAAQAAELQRTDDIAAGTAILGTAALVTSAILWLSSD